MKNALLIFPVLLFFIFSGNAQVLDDSFGKNGVVKGTEYPGADFIEQKPNGDLITIGSGLRYAKHIVGLFQLHENGSLDSVFTKNSNLQIESVNYPARSVAVQKDNKIVIAYRKNDVFDIKRYDSDGTTDASFKFHNYFPQKEGGYFKIALQSDQKIIGYIGYNSDEGYHTSQYLFRLNRDGSFDSSFGHNGLVFDFDKDKYGDYYYESISVDSTDRIICSGSVLWKNNQNPSELITSCYMPEGKIDKSFGSDGYAIFENPYKKKGGFHSGNVYLQIFSNNKILLATGYYENAFKLALINYLSNGLLDSKFGNNGTQSLHIENSFTGINDLKISETNRIFVATSSSFLYKANGNVYAFTGKGYPDSSFGTNGSLSLENGTINSIAVQQDNKLLVAGSSWLASYKYFIARFNLTVSDHEFKYFTNKTSSEENQKASGNKIKIYPNPAVSTINISGLNNAATIINVMDINGKSLRSERFDHLLTGTIDVSDLAQGIYFLQLQQHQKSKIFRFLKQ